MLAKINQRIFGNIAKLQTKREESLQDKTEENMQYQSLEQGLLPAFPAGYWKYIESLTACFIF